MRGQRRLLPDGLGRQRPAHRAPGRELLRRPLRPARSPTTPTSRPPPEAGQEAPGLRPDQPPQLHRPVRDADRRGREGLRGPVPPGRPLGRLGPARTRRSASTPSAPASGPSSATWPGARPTRPRRRACGTPRSRPPSPRPSSRTASAPRAYHDIAFHRTDGGGDVLISTTRPELLVSCVALVAHPDDERYQPLFDSTVTTPVFGVEVPIKAHPLAEPDKGTGIAMICTFGDTTDVTWWRELDLDTRAVIGKDGRFAVRPARVARHRRGPRARTAASPARPAAAPSRSWSSCSRETGELQGEPEKITHPVKFYERGDKPLEIVTTRQWYIRNGGRSADLRDDLVARGARAGLAPRVHAPPLRELGRGPQRRLARLPPAVLRRPDPALVPPRRRRRPRPRRPDRPRRLVAARSTRSRTSRPASPPTSATSPAASPATPTSWTPGPPPR